MYGGFLHIIDGTPYAVKAARMVWTYTKSERIVRDDELARIFFEEFNIGDDISSYIDNPDLYGLYLIGESGGGEIASLTSVAVRDYGEYSFSDREIEIPRDIGEISENIEYIRVYTEGGVTIQKAETKLIYGKEYYRFIENGKDVDKQRFIELVTDYMDQQDGQFRGVSEIEDYYFDNNEDGTFGYLSFIDQNDGLLITLDVYEDRK